MADDGLDYNAEGAAVSFGLEFPPFTVLGERADLLAGHEASLLLVGLRQRISRATFQQSKKRRSPQRC